jgi:hypothetical protein
MVPAALLLLALSIIFAAVPALLLYPVLLVFSWLGLALLYRGWKLRRKGKLHMRVGLSREQKGCVESKK